MSTNKQLLEFINKTNPDKLKVEEDLGLGYVRLNITEAQRRQAKDDIQNVESILVEMLRNSRDANADAIFVASWKQGSKRNLVIIDNGDGVPAKMSELIFEPRVTSKLDKLNYDAYGLHGRGMALYGIALNCEYSKVVHSKPAEKITAIKVVANTEKLPEKANQSTWPMLDSKGKIKDGPHNIARKCVEFYLQNRKLKIFYGNQTEILSQLLADGYLKIEKHSAKSVYDISNELELEISMRNCQRINSSQIISLRKVNEQAGYKSLAKTKRTLKSPAIASYFKKEELENILKESKDIVDEKGEKSFIKVSEDANISKVGNKLILHLPLEFEE